MVIRLRENLNWWANKNNFTCIISIDVDLLYCYTYNLHLIMLLCNNWYFCRITRQKKMFEFWLVLRCRACYGALNAYQVGLCKWNWIYVIDFKFGQWPGKSAKSSGVWTSPDTPLLRHSSPPFCFNFSEKFASSFRAVTSVPFPSHRWLPLPPWLVYTW